MIWLVIAWLPIAYSGCAVWQTSNGHGFDGVDSEQVLSHRAQFPTRDVQRVNFVSKTPYFNRPTTTDSACQNLQCVFGTYIDGPIFKLRNYHPEPTEFLDVPRADCRTRTWFFNRLPARQLWEHNEVCQRELDDYFYRPIWKLTGDILSDHQNFYSRQSLSELGVVMGVAALFANTSVDEDFRHWLHRQEMTEPHVDCWFNELGDNYYAAGLILGSYALAGTWRHFHGGSGPVMETLEDWSCRSLRSYLVGVPPELVLQVVIGASRPGESSAGSRWKTFDDNNGVSGHAFVGAIPFLVAAKMSKRPVVKTAFVLGSGLAGYARLCKDDHYLSQVILGWTLAYLSVEATTKTDLAPSRYRLVPLDLHGFHGLAVEIRR